MTRDIFQTRLKFRRHFFATVFAPMLGLLAWLIGPLSHAQSIDDVTLNVYKSETCGCCQGWIDHMTEHGYESKVFHPSDLNAIKAELGLKPEWQSCHTAVSRNGYLFEGHIPEKFIARFLADPPSGALGLAVPGMPIGGPGMEMGDRFTPYDILLINKDGSSAVYASIANADEQY